MSPEIRPKSFGTFEKQAPVAQLGRQAIQECSFKHSFPLNADSYDSLSLLFVSSHGWDPLAIHPYRVVSSFYHVMKRRNHVLSLERSELERKYIFLWLYYSIVWLPAIKILLTTDARQ